MGAAAILALIEASISIAKQLTDYIHSLKAQALNLGATPEEVAAAEARGHAAAAALTAKSDEILTRLGDA